MYIRIQFVLQTVQSTSAMYLLGKNTTHVYHISAHEKGITLSKKLFAEPDKQKQKNLAVQLFPSMCDCKMG